MPSAGRPRTRSQLRSPEQIAALREALAWLSGGSGAPLTALGVDRFGQSGARQELYRLSQIDVERIVAAAFAAADLAQGV